MSRMSPEARSAARMLAGGKPARVPKGFSKEAAEIWTGIVNGKPVDWFDRSAQELLGLYCRELAHANRLAAQLDTMRGHSDVDAEVLERRLIKLSGNCTTLATKLRLTVQSAISDESGMRTEKGDTDGDDLLGGQAWGGDDPWMVQ